MADSKREYTNLQFSMISHGVASGTINKMKGLAEFRALRSSASTREWVGEVNPILTVDRESAMDRL
jgi:hypothetical protein